MANQSKRIPTQHVIGFLASIALTLLAVWAVLSSDMPTTWIVISIMVLAVIQACIQLFMFMHMTEKESGGGHVPWNMMFHGFVLAAIVVAGSIFTMSFGFTHDHDDGEHGGHEQQQEEQHEGH
ncbi:cytochrome aa3 quinol oxidase subunit IV [Halobacillus sp. Marseille-Q1614]|uniref:cytochrome aa3 quinol oxidase subunit IV n=1 Tax=Halobacillus sp. Marseille-Q1614 TaxID=2709134 RepID=UPI00157107DB|nr:cytochrome aa3 quinol oxidase subunit IV [Halobacillus sp. Marseille-Q1614]